MDKIKEEKELQDVAWAFITYTGSDNNFHLDKIDNIAFNILSNGSIRLVHYFPETAEEGYFNGRIIDVNASDKDGVKRIVDFLKEEYIPESDNKKEQ